MRMWGGRYGCHAVLVVAFAFTRGTVPQPRTSANEKEESALRIANQELAKKRTILSLEAFAKERRQFEQRVLAVQKLVQKRKRQLDKSRVRAMRAVEKHMNGIVSDIATKRQALLVLRRTDTVLVARDLDITAVVLKRLNKELVKVSVEKPSD